MMAAGSVLEALKQYAQTLPCHKTLGQATMHCGTIKGGGENSSYPASCTLTLEFRTVPELSKEQILADLERILSRIGTEQPAIQFAPLKTLFQRPAHLLESGHELITTFTDVVKESTEKDIHPCAGAFWCDAALLGAKGIPTLIFGPSGEGLHGNDEYVNVESIREVDRIIEAMMKKVCN